MMDFFIEKICEANKHSDLLVDCLSNCGNLITSAHLSQIMNSDKISCKESYLEKLVPIDSFFPDLLKICAIKKAVMWFVILFDKSFKNEQLKNWFASIAEHELELFSTILAFKSPIISNFILDVSLEKTYSLKLSEEHLALMINTRCSLLTTKIVDNLRLQISKFPEPEKYEALKSILHLGEKNVFNKMMKYKGLNTCFQKNFQSLFKEAIKTSVLVLVESCLKHKPFEVENLNSFFDSVLEQRNVDIFNIVVEQMTELPEGFNQVLCQKTFLTQYPVDSLLKLSKLIKSEHIDENVMSMIMHIFVDKKVEQPFLVEIFKKVDGGLISDTYLTKLLETKFQNFDLIKSCLEKIDPKCIKQEHIEKLIVKCGDSPELIEIALEKKEKNEINRDIIFKLIDKGETFEDQRFSELTQLALSKMSFTQPNVRAFFSSEFKTLSAVVIDFMIANNTLDVFKSFFDTLLKTTSNDIKESSYENYMFLSKFLESLINIHGLQSLTNKMNMKFVYNILRHFPDFVEKNKSEFKTAIIPTAEAPDKTVIELLDLDVFETHDLPYDKVEDISLGSLVLRPSLNEEENCFLNQLLQKISVRTDELTYPDNFFDCFGDNLFTISFFGTQNFVTQNFGEKHIPKGFLYYELNAPVDVASFNGWLDTDNASLYKDTLNQVKVYFITQKSEQKLEIKLADITDPKHSNYAELPLFMKSAIIDNTISYDQYKNETHLKFILETLSKCMDEEFKDSENNKEYAKKMFSIMKTAMQVIAPTSYELTDISISTDVSQSIEIKEKINSSMYNLLEDESKFLSEFNNYLSSQEKEPTLELAYICGQFSKAGVLGYHHGKDNDSNQLFRFLCLQCLETYKELSTSQGVDVFIIDLKAGECIQTIMYDLQKKFSLNGFKRNTA